MQGQGDDESIDEFEIEIDFFEDKDEGTSGDPTRDRDAFSAGKSADAKTPPPIPRDARDKAPGRGR